MASEAKRRGPAHYVDARSQAQALVAARAVHECRVIVKRSHPLGVTLDNELYDFELALYRHAESLAARQARRAKK